MTLWSHPITTFGGGQAYSFHKSISFFIKLLTLPPFGKLVLWLDKNKPGARGDFSIMTP
jgi:hypothetical protein